MKKAALQNCLKNGNTVWPVGHLLIESFHGSLKIELVLTNSPWNLLVACVAISWSGTERSSCFDHWRECRWDPFLLPCGKGWDRIWPESIITLYTGRNGSLYQLSWLRNCTFYIHCSWMLVCVSAISPCPTYWFQSWVPLVASVQERYSWFGLWAGTNERS